MKNQHFGAHQLGKRLFSLSMAIVVSLSMGFSSAVFAQSPTPFTAIPLNPISTITVPKNLAVNAQGLTSVIVKLKNSPLASYQGDVAGYPATSPAATGDQQLNFKSAASQQYIQLLDQQHAQFKQGVAAIPGAKVTNDFVVVLNAVSVVLPAANVDTLASLPDVEAIYPDTLQHPDTDNSPQFIGAPTAWTALGGQESSGEGVIVGVIDTGIWPEHPSFSDPDPSGKAYAAPAAPPSGVARACEFGATSTDPAFTCNNKLIGAKRVMTTYDTLLGPNPDGYASARDDDGHGTHTSSTAAGNAGVAASIFGVSRGTISGIAPRAHVIMYKALGAGGGFTSDLTAAIEQAIKDGVNVINYSISGGASPYGDPAEQAFLDAYNAGIFVAASAGNSGPSPDTTDHRGPWVTTVAASTQNRGFANTLTVVDGTANFTVSGASITAGVGPAPIVVPTDTLCSAPFAGGSVAGKIVVCKRGVSGRAEKGYNVLQGGAVGMILYNQSTGVTDVETDNHYLPAIHIQYTEGQNLLTFLTAHPTAQGTLTAGAKVSSPGDVMASFSSRGGPGQTIGVSKPDITAPGVQVLAGASPAHFPPSNPDGLPLGPQGQLFQAIAGTSMSSPHIAGSGALIKALHPDWTPGQIKSALMTTANTQVVKEDGTTPATVFDDGSGRVDLTKAGDPGLTFNVSGTDYTNHSADLWNTNYPSVFDPVMPGIISITRVAHSTLNYASTWALSVQGAVGFSVNVPATLSVPPSSDGAFSITIDGSDMAIGDFGSATLVLKETSGTASRTLHMPISFIRKEPNVTLTKSCSSPAFAIGAKTTCTITANNLSFSNANVAVTDLLPAQLQAVAGTVTGGTISADLKTVSFFGNLSAAPVPDVTIATGPTPAGGYLPLASLGVIPIAGVGDETITAFTVPAFTYAGDTYTSLSIDSNGYLMVGGGTVNSTTNQNLPNPADPNNVLAPFWTDLNPGVGGSVYIGELTDGTNKWIVVDFAAVKEFSTAATDTFEVWIGEGTTQDVSFVYGPVNGNGDNGLLTVGAENKFGNRGQNYYFKGSTGSATGTLPTSSTQLVVSGTGGPGGSHTITFDAARVQTGKWINYAHLTSDQFQGINVFAAPWPVKMLFLQPIFR